MKKQAAKDGALHIVAFDSQYSDNAGDYEVKFLVIRPSHGESEGRIRAQLS